MNKNLHYRLLVLTYLLLVVCLASPAQIIIQQQDMPTPGKNIVMAEEDTDLSPQNASASFQTWNYGGLHYTGSQFYILANPDTTPYFSAFQSSNVADSLAYASGYTYFSSTPTSFSGSGFGEVLYGYKAGIAFHPLFEQLPLPATYNTIDGGRSRGDTSLAISYSSFDSGRVVVNITYSDTVDAWGVMTTPFTTDSVIRQKHKDVTVDSILVHDTLLHAWVTYTIETTKDNQYRWYAKGINYFFALMIMNTADTKDSVMEWYSGNQNNLGVSPVTASNGNFMVYPNPCSTEINFINKSTLLYNSQYYIHIYDITGRQLSQYIVHSFPFTISNMQYANGLYLYSISDDSGNILSRGKFIVSPVSN